MIEITVTTIGIVIVAWLFICIYKIVKSVINTNPIYMK